MPINLTVNKPIVDSLTTIPSHILTDKQTKLIKNATM